jgi:hypothetical protein
MTGYESKRAAARDKLEDDDTQVYQTELTKLLMESYDKGVADALAETKAAPPQLLAHIKFLEDELLHLIADGYYSPYTTPPQRPWVGLTDEEKDGKRVLENGLLFNAAEVQAWELGVDYSEAKLKEKNA